MIILDTNVLSALMQQQPDPVVVNWPDAQPAEAIWISSITLLVHTWLPNAKTVADPSTCATPSLQA